MRRETPVPVSYTHLDVYKRQMQMSAPANPDDPMEGHDHTECRSFTDSLMHEIARLAERPYVDEYVPSRATAPAG